MLDKMVAICSELCDDLGNLFAQFAGWNQNDGSHASSDRDSLSNGT
jgi:hypothetical protein